MLSSPLGYFGNRSHAHEDIFEAILAHKQARGDKPYRCCYDLFAGSGSLSFQAMVHGLAERYVMNDAYRALADFWHVLQAMPSELTSEYLRLENELSAASDKAAVYAGLQAEFNAGQGSSPTQAARFALLINHAYGGLPYLNKQGVLACVYKEKDQEDAQGTISTKQFTDSAEALYRVFKGLGDKLCVAASLFNAPALIDPYTLTPDDLVLLDPPYPDMEDGEESPDKHIYARPQTKHVLQGQLQDFIDILQARDVPFLMFYGVQGLANACPIRLPDQQYLRISGGLNHPYKEYVENVYVSRHFVRYLKAVQLPRCVRLDVDLQEKIAELKEDYQAIAGYIKTQTEDYATWNVPFPLLLEARVRAHPLQLAIRQENGFQLSYEALDQQVNRLAHYLSEVHHIEAGQLVGLLVSDTGGFIVSLLALWKLRAAYVPMSVSQPREVIAETIECSKPVFCFATGELPPALRALNAVAFPSPDCLKGYPSSSPASTAGLSPDDLAYVMFTSGTSGGVPKAAAILHRGLPYAIQSHKETLRLSPSDRVAQMAQVGFDASLMEILMTLGSGASLYPVDRNTRDNHLTLTTFFQTHDISQAILVPSKLRDLRPGDFLALKGLVITGEAFEEVLIRPWLDAGRVIVNGYGPTEATICTTLGVCTGQGLTIGKPIRGTRIHLVPAVSQKAEEEEKEATIVNEMCITGMSLAQGYWQNEEETRARFVALTLPTGESLRVYRSGDEGERLENGDYRYLGRLDHQIKLRGQRLEPAHVEAVIRDYRLSGKAVVSDVVVVCVERPQGKHLVAYLLKVPAVNDEVPVFLIHEYLKKKLPGFMVPNAMAWVERADFYTPNGKVNRKALSAREKIPFISLGEARVSPRGKAEKTVAKIWSKLLDFSREAIGRQSDFFCLGGTSLIVSQLLREFCEHFRDSPQPSPDDIYKNGYLWEQARLFKQSPLRALGQGASTGARLYLVHSLLGDGWSDYPALENAFGLTVYAYRGAGLDEPDERVEHIDELAKSYVTALIEREAKSPPHPSGGVPFVMGGWSTGGLVALAMQAQLKAQGYGVVPVILLDTPRPQAVSWEEVIQVGGLLAEKVCGATPGWRETFSRREIYPAQTDEQIRWLFDALDKLAPDEKTRQKLAWVGSLFAAEARYRAGWAADAALLSQVHLIAASHAKETPASWGALLGSVSVIAGTNHFSLPSTPGCLIEIQASIRRLERDSAERAYLQRLVERNNYVAALGLVDGERLRIPLSAIYINLEADRLLSHDRASIFRSRQHFIGKQLSRADFLPPALKAKVLDFLMTHHGLPVGGQLTEAHWAWVLEAEDAFLSFDEKVRIEVAIDRACQAALDALLAVATQAKVDEASSVMSVDKAYTEHRHMVLLGHPGAGKTTIARWLSYQAAEKRLEDKANDHKEGQIKNAHAALLPILLSIGQYEKYAHERQFKTSVWAFIKHQAQNGVEEALLEAALTSGDALVVMDGFDEISQPDYRDEIARHIHAFMAHYGLMDGKPEGNRLIVTSRIVGNYTAPLDNALPRLTLQGMDIDSLERYLRHWIAAADEATRTAEKRDMEQLLSMIQSDSKLFELLKVPQMANAFVMVYYRDGSLPKTRIELYGKATANLMASLIKRVENTHDLGKKRGLFSVESLMGKLFEAVAMAMLPGSNCLSSQDLEHCVAMWCQGQGQGFGFNEAMLLNLVRKDLGLLIDHGEHEHHFLHRSFQEYFAARALLKGERHLISRLLEKLDNPVWHDTLLFVLSYAALTEPLSVKPLVLGLLAHDPLSRILPRAAFLVVEALAELNESPMTPDDRQTIVMQTLASLFSTYARYGDGAPYQAVRESIEEKLQRLNALGYATCLEAAFEGLLQDEKLAAPGAFLMERVGFRSARTDRLLIGALDNDTAAWGWPINRALKNRTQDPGWVPPLDLLPFRAALAERPDWVARIVNHPELLRLVMLLYGGMHDYGVQSYIRQSQGVAGYFNVQDVEKKKRDKAPTLACQSMFDITAIYRDSVLTKSLVPILAQEVENDMLKKLEHMSWDTSTPVPNKVDAIIGLIALKGDITTVLGSTSNEVIQAVLQRVESTDANLQDIICRSEGEFSKLVNLTPNLKNLGSLFFTFIRHSDNPLSIEEPKEGNSECYAEYLVSLLNNLRQNAITRSILMRNLVFQDVQRFHEAMFLLLRTQQIRKSTVNFGWSLPMLGMIDHPKDIPSLFFDMLETAPQSMSMFLDAYFNFYYTYMGHHNSALLPEIFMVAMALVNVADRERLLIRLKERKYPASKIALSALLYKEVSAQRDPYYRTRGLCRYARNFAKGAVPRKELFWQSLESARTIDNELRAYLAFETIIRHFYEDCLDNNELYMAVYIDIANAIERVEEDEVRVMAWVKLAFFAIEPEERDYWLRKSLLACRKGGEIGMDFTQTRTAQQTELLACLGFIWKILPDYDQLWETGDWKILPDYHQLWETGEMPCNVDSLRNIEVRQLSPLEEGDLRLRLGNMLKRPKRLILGKSHAHYTQKRESAELKRSIKPASFVTNIVNSTRYRNLMLEFRASSGDNLPGLFPVYLPDIIGSWGKSTRSVSHGARVLDLIKWALNVAKDPAPWTALLLSAQLHDVKIQPRPEIDISNAWLALQHEPTTARFSALRTRLVNQMESLSMVAALVLDRFLGQPEWVESVVELLTHLTQMELEVLPMVQRWLRHPHPWVAGYAAVLLAETHDLSRTTFELILPLLTCPLDLLRHRAAYAIHDSGIAAKGKYRWLSFFDEDCFLQLHKAMLNEALPIATRLRVRWFFYNFKWDDPEMVVRWMNDLKGCPLASPRSQLLVSMLESIECPNKATYGALITGLLSRSSRGQRAMLTALARIKYRRQQFNLREIRKALERVDATVLAEVWSFQWHNNSAPFYRLLRNYFSSQGDGNGAVLHNFLLHSSCFSWQLLTDKAVDIELYFKKIGETLCGSDTLEAHWVRSAEGIPATPDFLAFLIRGLVNLLALEAEKTKPYLTYFMLLVASGARYCPVDMADITHPSFSTVLTPEEIAELESRLIALCHGTDYPRRQASLTLLAHFGQASVAILGAFEAAIFDVEPVKATALSMAEKMGKNRNPAFIQRLLERLAHPSAEFVYWVVKVLKAIALHPQCPVDYKTRIVKALLDKLGDASTQQFVYPYYAACKIPDLPRLDALIFDALLEIGRYQGNKRTAPKVPNSNNITYDDAPNPVLTHQLMTSLPWFSSAHLARTPCRALAYFCRLKEAAFESELEMLEESQERQMRLALSLIAAPASATDILQALSITGISIDVQRMLAIGLIANPETTPMQLRDAYHTRGLAKEVSLLLEMAVKAKDSDKPKENEANPAPWNEAPALDAAPQGAFMPFYPQSGFFAGPRHPPANNIIVLSDTELTLGFCGRQ